MNNYKICNKCLMDTSDPEIIFFEDGSCNHCNSHLNECLKFDDKEKNKKTLDSIVNSIRETSKRSKYDCVIGISGGVDSTYIAYLTKTLGLNPLAVHVDNGWNSELAVDNIQNTLSILKIDLETVVLNWSTFRELQKSFLKASVSDGELPTDHAIRSSLWSVANKYGIKYLLNGRNYATEGIMPRSWTYSALDWKYIKGVHYRFSKKSLKDYPHVSLYEVFKNLLVIRPKNISILNYLKFDKVNAKKILKEKLKWRDYGGKHYESVYTKFYQGYILPKKFGIDKRRAHLSSMICSKHMSRTEGLEILKKPPLNEDEIKVEKKFILKKLQISDFEFNKIMMDDLKCWSSYPNNSKYLLLERNKKLLRVAKYMKKRGIIPRGFGDNLLVTKENN